MTHVDAICNLLDNYKSYTTIIISAWVHTSQTLKCTLFLKFFCVCFCISPYIEWQHMSHFWNFRSSIKMQFVFLFLFYFMMLQLVLCSPVLVKAYSFTCSWYRIWIHKPRQKVGNKNCVWLKCFFWLFPDNLSKLQLCFGF